MPERFYVTTPIFYPNDRPHLGTAYATVTADALARWHRLCGEEVLFLTGTDEHGLKIARRAEEQGMTPQAWTDETAQWFRDAWKALLVTNDDFIRTTEARHTEAVQAFMQSIHDNGHIYKAEYAGWYCVACEAYYAESELTEGRLCPLHGTPVEWFVEENYFFRLSAFEDRLLEWYANSGSVVVPEAKRNEAVSFIRQGLQDISITRTSIDWGIPVPWDPEHVVYVWYDALVNYITAIGYGVDEERFSSWWPFVHHLIGKDILRFHCVWWPAMCMAAGIDPPHQLIVHGFLLVGGEKMSKSRLNQVDPVELAKDLGVDALRYHLLREVTLGSDGDFSYEALVARYNSDLANNLGNLAQRVATVVGSKCGGVGPAPRPAGEENAIATAAATVVAEAREAWARFAPQDALAATWRLVHETNAELEATEPWKMAPGPEVDSVLGNALEALRIVTILASPAVPLAAAEIWRRLGLDGTPDEAGRASESRGELDWGGYPGGLTVTKGEPIFPRRHAPVPTATSDDAP
ncbi:MAG: methionyl-tRNA synthetase [Acidimicrobiaceae bacterium]|nr:methionyl-tRNA synthetase [Acidimicrobiaceae bacterium]